MNDGARRGIDRADVLLVTGGAGFVGSHLIRKLAAACPDAQIASIDNYFLGSTDNHFIHDRVRYFTGDTRRIDSIWASTGLPGPRTVFHLGEYSRIVQSFGDFDRVWDFNLLGTKAVIQFCHAHGSRLVYAGSSSKFGNDGSDQHLSPYAWIKAKNVELIANFADWFGLDYVITYFHNVYGPGQLKTGHYATVIGIFESQYEQGKPLTVVSPGTQTRDFTYVEDIVDGIIACWQEGQGDGYQLGTGEDYTIIEVAKLFGGDYVLVPERIGERKSGRADAAKARSLGWAPKHSLPDYIRNFKDRIEAQRQRAE